MDPLRFGETPVRPEAMDTGFMEGVVDETGRAIFTHEVTLGGAAPEETGVTAPDEEAENAAGDDAASSGEENADGDTGGDSTDTGATAPGRDGADGQSGENAAAPFKRTAPLASSRAMKLRRGEPEMTTAELLASKPEKEIDTSMYDIHYHPEEIVRMSAARASKRQFDFVLPGLAVGDVGLLVAPGGTGKTVMATVMALRVALGMDGLTAGGVIMICAEDDETSLQIRLRGLAESYCLKDGDIELADRNLVCWPCSGMGVDITTHDDTDSNRLQSKIYNIVRHHPWADKPRLLVLDTLRRMSSLLENSNDDMSTFIKICEKIARRTGMAVLIVHHASKTTVLNGNAGTQQAARGGSALVDNAKFCSHLLPMTAEEAEAMDVDEEERKTLVKFTVSKCNRGPTPPPCWYTREENGSLVPRRMLTQKSDPPARDARKAALRESVIKMREKDEHRTMAQKKKSAEIFNTYGFGVYPDDIVDKMEKIVDTMPEDKWDDEIGKISAEYEEYKKSLMQRRPIRDYGGLLPRKVVKADDQTGPDKDAGGTENTGGENGQVAADDPAQKTGQTDPNGGDGGQAVKAGDDPADGDPANGDGPATGDEPAGDDPAQKTDETGPNDGEGGGDGPDAKGDVAPAENPQDKTE